MMIVDLLDLEDLVSQLRGKGIEVTAADDASTVKTAVANWLQTADSTEQEALKQWAGDLLEQHDGMILPEAKALLQAIQQD